MNELRFTEDHEWIRIEGDDAVVGITDYAQDRLGELVFIELPEVGAEFERGAEAHIHPKHIDEDEAMALNMRTGKPAHVSRLDHVNILTNDVDACRRFYVDALGFEEGYRPPFNLPGVWLYLDGAPVIHVVEVTEPLPRHSGNIDHIAFCAHDFDRFTAMLDAKGIAYEDRAVPGIEVHQLFCFDPHGIKIEFNFKGRDRPRATLEREHKQRTEPAAGT